MTCDENPFDVGGLNHGYSKVERTLVLHLRWPNKDNTNDSSGGKNQVALVIVQTSRAGDGCKGGGVL